MNKYGAKRTWSELCQRTFASKAECVRGEELCLLEKAGGIASLDYQIPFVLCQKPKIAITIDFCYRERLQQDKILERAATQGDADKIILWGETIYEDVKGVLTRDFRTKLAWLEEKHGIKVRLET